MRTLNSLILGAAVALAIGTPALATDLFVETTPTVMDEGTDWSGFYIGVLGGVSFGSIPDCGSECNSTLPGIAKVVGFNWVNGDVIFGVDEMVVASFWPYDSQYPVRKIEWQKMFRVGTKVSDNVMVYGAIGGGVGYLWINGASEGHLGYGAIAAGVEMALNEHAIWRTHLQFSRSAQFDPCSGCYVQAVSIGTGIVWLM